MRLLLISLLAITGLSALISGSIMITRPDGSIFNLSTDLLASTPFKDFLVPGIILAAVVGGVNLIALFFIMGRHASRYNWSLAGGIILSGWIIMQMILVPAVTWFHLLYLVSGAVIVLISLQLKGKWAV